MSNEEIEIGDNVVWNFVFDMPQEKGIVVALKGDKVQVEYEGYVFGGGSKVCRDWLNVEEVVLDENWVF